MPKRKSKAEGSGARAKRALQFVDHLAERDQLTFGLLTGYALKKAADLEPESLAAILTGALVKLSELNRAAYDGLGAQIVWNTLKDRLNGSTTQFASMQYEHDAWSWQGQWFKIGYDELAEFTFTQWNATAAWNRCPVSPYCTKDGATNPIGVGAGWIKKLFIDRKPCDEMDEHQRRQYKAEDYEYFPCTYLDNPIYANDPAFIQQLESYPAPIRDALKHGTWGLVGGYFTGAWDPAVNVYAADSVEIKPWWEKWMSGDWGFEHQSAIYWHAIDDLGVIRTYREFVTRHEPPETLAESIAAHSLDEDGKIPRYRGFYFSHDTFAKKTDANTIALRIGRVLAKHGLPSPTEASRDKIGREQLMYQLLNKRIRVGEDAEGHAMEAPAWQISDACPKLIDCIPAAPRDESDPEKIAEFLGDDPLQGAGYGLYAKLGRPTAKPKQVQLQEKLLEVQRDWAAEHGIAQPVEAQVSASDWAARFGGRILRWLTSWRQMVALWSRSRMSSSRQHWRKAGHC